jgi:hypothetical protein
MHVYVLESLSLVGVLAPCLPGARWEGGLWVSIGVRPRGSGSRHRWEIMGGTWTSAVPEDDDEAPGSPG